jgi:S-formylglutathione hydrolase FrmB
VRAMLLAAVVACLVVGLVGPSAGATETDGAPAVTSSNGLDVESSRWLGPRLLEVRARTTALRDTTTFRVLLPTGYADDPHRRFPVLYLLHGGGDDYRYWTDKADVARIVGDAPVIVVMPDGGYGGWYTDWFNGGLGGPPKWETFHVGQLIPWVDANFRTRAERAGRAVAGLSMGGFGTMSYTARHAGEFVAAASFSGAVDLLDPEVTVIVDLSPLPTFGVPTSVFGPRLTNEPRWRAHNPPDLAARLRGTELAIYTGDGRPGPLDDKKAVGADSTEAAVHRTAYTFHRALDAAGVAHRFIDYGPGTHTTPYWQRDLRQELPHIMAAFHAHHSASSAS